MRLITACRDDVFFSLLSYYYSLFFLSLPLRTLRSLVPFLWRLAISKTRLIVERDQQSGESIEALRQSYAAVSRRQRKEKRRQEKRRDCPAQSLAKAKAKPSRDTEQNERRKEWTDGHTFFCFFLISSLSPCTAQDILQAVQA